MINDPFRPHTFELAYTFKVEGLAGNSGADSVEANWRRFSYSGWTCREATGCTTGGDQFQNHRPGINDWGELTLQGAITKDRKAMLDWYKAMQKADDVAMVLKDITIHIQGRDGATIRSVNFLRCFLTSYALCPLNGDERDVIAEESITIRVGHSDNYLT
jgi:hypothetical protein